MYNSITDCLTSDFVSIAIAWLRREEAANRHDRRDGMHGPERDCGASTGVKADLFFGVSLKVWLTLYFPNSVEHQSAMRKRHRQTLSKLRSESSERSDWAGV